MRPSTLAFVALSACASSRPAQPSSAPPSRPGGPQTAYAAGPSPCGGARVDIAAASQDARCAIDEEQANEIRRGIETRYAKTPWKVEASLLPSGEIELRLMNADEVPLLIPLFLSQVVDTYPVTARRGSTVVRLSAHPSRGETTAVWERGRNFAVVSVSPGGVAFALLALDPTVREERYDCAPNEKCSPTIASRGPLPTGSWELEIGLPIYATVPHSGTVAWSQR